MKNNRYPIEKGSTTINGHKMEWSMRRSKGESAFGIRGCRIFELELKKDGAVIAKYDRAWDTSIKNEDEEGAICLSYLMDRYGRQASKQKKER